MFQLAYLIFAPIIGANLQRMGRKTSIIIGYGFIVLATIGFGSIVYVQDE